MKFYESHFEEYITENKKCNLHPNLEKIYNKFPKSLCDLKNVIFYGPSGIGKYTQLLKCIKKYSPSELKYEKKLSILYNKQSYFYKISDIHYEIDMSLLGCNSKLLWHEIYHNFYSYMQKNYNYNINIVFFLITESVSFIPDNILNCCEIIQINRPSKSMYNKCLSKRIKLNNAFQIKLISNIKK